MTSESLVSPTTRIDLLRQRERLLHLEELHALLAQMGYRDMAVRVWQDRSALYLTVLQVEVPCVLCRNLYPVPVQVGDPERTMPNAVLCIDCSQRVEGSID